MRKIATVTSVVIVILIVSVFLLLYFKPSIKLSYKSIFKSLTAQFIADEPPKEPILRIETGMHTASISRIGIDDQNRFLVTASLDKTVRLWDLSTVDPISTPMPSTRYPISTLRPPIGEGKEGMIYSVAISPDGNTIACGGWTGYQWDKSNSIYLFERESGGLVKRIKGLPGSILHLAYSKDGRFLTATLGRRNEVRIFRTSDYSQIAEDRDYGDASYGADFDTRGRLVTTSIDGFIRLYDNNFKLIAKNKATEDKPYGVKFSPDDSMIAVGFSDSPRVNVVSGDDLSFLYSPDNSGVDNGSLSKVAWSSDGSFLYAGGAYGEVKGGGFINLIRRWGDKGKGDYRDLPASNDTVMHILPLKDGGIVFGSLDPAFGTFSYDGDYKLYEDPLINDYRGLLENFLISYDGSIVQFAYEVSDEVSGQFPARFSILDRLLMLNPDETDSLRSPITSSNGLDIKDWKNTYNPQVNGKTLKLGKDEFSRSLAISPDGNTFLLGAEWYLRLFDRHCNEIWNVSTPSIAWSVNISQNGKVAVAAYGDGTIRWYRMSDGKELLAFFPLRDKKRWVLWTPSGYYDASPGGEDLIGWHVNNGKDNAADFFPASRFRSVYYRPDLISKVLETLDEQEAFRLANLETTRKTTQISIERMLPPVITIVSPKDNEQIETTEITVRYTIRTPSGEPVTDIKVLIDGRPRPKQKGITSPYEGTESVTVTIPGKDSAISILAENKYAVSEPATVKVRWKGEVSTDESQVKPKLYLLAIGVGEYEKENLRLDFPAKDANDFTSVMTNQKDLLYREVASMVITDENATKDNILEGLDWIQKKTTSNDVAMVFISGHGVNDQYGDYYYLPVNADLDSLIRTGVPSSYIKKTVEHLDGKALFFLDTCHSGNLMGTRPDITKFVNELSSPERGAVVFASSSGNQDSLENPEWNNGAFTKALVEGLRGEADYIGKGEITIYSLNLYLSQSVKKLTGGKQTPTTTIPNTIADFTIAVTK